MNRVLAKKLLAWYDENGRELPWRVKGGAHPNPYFVWVSEVMLQQTGVKTVIPYFERFILRFPSLEALAEADLEEVYLYWQGLGYYSRARSLHATALMLVKEYGAKFPKTLKELLKLKGIGPYTAASFLALAFNQKETVVDGNVIRVICRLYDLRENVKEISGLIRERAEALTDEERPADYASAIMDLGAMVCVPKKPKCESCPWRQSCLAFKRGSFDEIPVLGKLSKKFKEGRVFLIFNGKGEVFIQKRAGKGLLSGLYEFPWREEGGKPFVFEKAARDTGVEVVHTFTHFKLRLRVFTLVVKEVSLDGEFAAEKDLENFAFSTLMRKVYERGKG